MNTPLQQAITAKDGTDFYKAIASFSFEGFIQQGVGCVVIQEGNFAKHQDGKVEAVVLYVPWEAGNPLIPAEAAEMINAYEPESSVVLCIVSENHSATCLTLTAEKIGCSPVIAHMKGREWHVDIEPGSVLRLNVPVGDTQAGVYVFLREENAQMKLAQAVMDADEGDVLAGDEVVDVHVDFRDAFVPMGINVYYGTGGHK
ncbi:MAG: hypothetical protein K8T26_01525 [Lentisphaerae bacterium]|nr:hypothetical protein [Lentisphaerota bacterium]